MLKQHPGSLPSVDSDAEFIALEPYRHEAARHDESSALADTARDQLAREIAEIETATAALRRAEPALESWTSAPPATLHKPRPVWLLIGVLWLSTVLVTAGAVVAIATLRG
ncbi:MAG TPA: hypothetical protein VMR17_15270 [Xanthobacteraceae bacterium]|jgi:hypothetical protein|nr:hypothetical protein [Xanthobacteraceae bacterium]